MDKISALKKLKGYLEEGIITAEEFTRQKDLILGSKPKVESPVENKSEIALDEEAQIVAGDPATQAPQVTSVEPAVRNPLVVQNTDVPEDNEENAMNWIEGGGIVAHHPLAPQEELAGKEDKTVSPSSLLWLGIAACALGIIVGVIYLLSDNIVDRVVKYEKAGVAVLQLEKTGPAPHIIVMDKKGLYYDNKFSIMEILPVGKEIDTREIHLHYDANNGLLATADEAEQKFAVVSSQGIFVKRLTDNTYLLTTKQLDGNPLADYNLSLESCYLVVKKAKSKEVTVIKVPKSKTDGYGNVRWRLSSNILSHYDTYFKKALSKKDYNTSIEREYGHYLAIIELSLETGRVQIDDPVEFDKLGTSYPAKDVGTVAHSSSMRETIQGILRRELEESFYNAAAQKTGVSNRDYMKITDDDKYTFVINPNYRTGSQPKGLLRVDNKTQAVTLIDTGKEIEFFSSSICVTKIETFLIFFDSETKVYYDYTGARRN